MRSTRDDGTATVEFVTVAVVLTIPLVYVLLTVFAVQRAAFAVTAAAREAGRAYVAERDPQAAADLALADQLPGSPRARLTVEEGGATVRVTVAYEVDVLGLGTIPVTATHVATPDRYR